MQEIVSFSEGMGGQVESQETLLRILAGKMTARQILTFLSSLPQESTPLFIKDSIGSSSRPLSRLHRPIPRTNPSSFFHFRASTGWL